MKRLAILGFAILLVAVITIIWWNVSLQPVNTHSLQTQNFVIAKGDGVRDIAKKLRDQGLIRDQIAFFILIKYLGIEKNIQAGSYHLGPKMNATTIAQSLTLGTEDKWLTVVEGLRSEEILEQLQQEKINEGKWTVAGETARWKADEGRLFPDTYLIPKEITVEALHQLLRANFDKKLTDQTKADIKNSGRTEEEVLILASLLEREGKTDADRAQISDVILKRIMERMALNIDATVQYALGKQANGSWWKKDLTIEDLKVNSPFNTYQNSGLPPKAICNPGLSALRAAAYPTNNPYYYYISDKNGVIHYAKTLEEHNQNVAKYL